MSKIYQFLILFLFLASKSVSLWSQETVKLRIVTNSNTPISGITVYGIDGFACYTSVTDKFGEVTFEFEGKSFLFYAADLSGKNNYGVSSL